MSIKRNKIYFNVREIIPFVKVNEYIFFNSVVFFFKDN